MPQKTLLFGVIVDRLHLSRLSNQFTKRINKLDLNNKKGLGLCSRPFLFAEKRTFAENRAKWKLA